MTPNRGTSQQIGGLPVGSSLNPCYKINRGNKRSTTTLHDKTNLQYMGPYATKNNQIGTSNPTFSPTLAYSFCDAADIQQIVYRTKIVRKVSEVFFFLIL